MRIEIYFGEAHAATIHLVWLDPVDWLLDRVEITYADNLPAPLIDMIANAIFKNSEAVTLTGGLLVEDLQFHFEAVQAAVLELQSRITNMRVLWPEDLPARILTEGVKF